MPIILLTLLVMLVSYAWFIEPNWVQMEIVDMTVPALPAGHEELKIVFLTDLHIRHLGRREKKALELTSALAPHLILIGGDLVEKKERLSLALEFLEGLKAPLGKFAVRGNWEIQLIPQARHLMRELDKVSVRLLLNEHQTVKFGGATIKIAGIDDYTLGGPNLDRALGHDSPADFTILLSHEPIIVERIGERQIDLILAGHSHGGQVALPGIRPPWLPRGVGKYVKGDFKRGNTLMHVSRGLGTCGLPIRLGSPPEVTLVRLGPQQ